MKIYNIGSLNIDYVYSVDNFVLAGETKASANMEIFPGGKGLNQSIALAKAGAKVIHGAYIGNGGDFLLEKMKEAGVDISRIIKTDSSCGHAIIQVDKTGQNCILLYAGTNHALNREYIEEFLKDADENDMLILQNETNALDIIFEIATYKKMQIVFNPSPLGDNIKELPLENVKWWFCNEIEGEALFGNSNPREITKNFINKYPNSNLILTLGKRGSIFKNKDMELAQSIYETKAVDTTAAGDTFTGFFIAAVSNGKDIATALKLASKASAIGVSRKGAAESIPTIKEVEKDI